MSRDAVPGILAGRLNERREQIEQAALARVIAISDPAEVEDPAYVSGLREAVVSALSYCLASIETPTKSPEPIPLGLLSQARLAARNRVSLDTVLRRYFAGYTLLGDFLVSAAEEGGVPPADLQRALRGEAALFDRLVASITEEYNREAGGRCRTSEERRAAQVRMLLGGEPIAIDDLDYEFDAWHTALVATGSRARTVIRAIAASLGRRLLAIAADDGAVWAWLGGDRELPAAEAVRSAESSWSGALALAIGEPGHGIEGWRFTHRQARAALPVALRESPGIISYSEAALVASALQDDVLAATLAKTYLAPFESEKDGGKALRRTLQAYLAAGQNVSSAAAALGVSRQTVKNRLGLAERLYGRPLGARAPEIETALRLHEIRFRE
jgi:hypothetical protein